jgi:hypothetical protein
MEGVENCEIEYINEQTNNEMTEDNFNKLSEAHEMYFSNSTTSSVSSSTRRRNGILLTNSENIEKELQMDKIQISKFDEAL